MAGVVGTGLTVGSLKLTSSSDKSENVLSLSEESEFPLEYFLVNSKSEKECGRFSERIEQGGQVGNCSNTLWAKKISAKHKDRKEMGWWITGEKNLVDLLLKSWSSFKGELKDKDVSEKRNTSGGISSLKEKEQDKCKIEEKENTQRIEIFCQ